MKPPIEILSEMVYCHCPDPNDPYIYMIHQDLMDKILKHIAIESYNQGVLSAKPGGGHNPNHLEEFERLIGIRK